MTDETDLPEPFSDPLRVPQHVAKLLARIARGWTPLPMRPRQVEKLDWGGEDLSRLAQQVTVHGTKLLVQCEGDSLVEWILGEKPHELRNRSFAGTTSDGGEFGAESGGANTGMSMKVGPESSKRTGNLSISGYPWFISYKPATSWVAKLELKSLHGDPNNLVIKTPSGWSRMHLRLEGAKYTYYIIKSKEATGDSYHVVVDVGQDSRPESATFCHDVYALEFALGQSLRLGVLHGVDANGDVVGYSSGNYQRFDPAIGSVKPAVPVYEPWAALLFHALSKELATTDSLIVPIRWYVESLLNHLDGEYVGLHIALGSIGRTILARQDAQGSRLIVSPQHWIIWLETQREALSHIAESGKADALFEQVDDACRPSVEWSVRCAFERVGLTISNEMSEELRRREQVFTEGKLVDMQEALSLDALVTRVKIVRCMVAALVAKAIGYQGAIQGWERDPSGHYESAAWFPYDPAVEEEARQIYVAETDDVPADVVKLWPHFAEPQLPEEGLLRTVVSFAAALVQRTSGRVVAQVQPVVDMPKKQKERWYEFKILLAGNPSTQSVLLTIVDPGDGTLVIRDWGDDKNITTENELAKFLGEFAGSEAVQAAVERMMIYAAEAREG